MAFERISKGISGFPKVFKGFFNQVSWVFQESFYDTPRKFQGISMKYFVGFKRVQKNFKGCSRCFMHVSWKFSGCFREVLRLFHGSFKVVTRKFQGHFKKVFYKED